jgi:hypothetical protein
MPVALALVTTLGVGLGLASLARADGLLFQNTIPREVDAYDFKTGGPYMAPPVPYGHYAKDYIGGVQKATGCLTCKLHGLFGGPGAGHGLLHKGGHGDDAGLGDGAIVSDGGGHGLFGHHGAGAGAGLGHFGHLHGGAGVATVGYATTGTQPSAQTVVQPSSQSVCGQPGCKVGSKHSHLGNLLNKLHCGSCGGSGCGTCGGTGLCGDPGTGCGLCGGRGCSNCLAGLKAGLHGKLASLTGAFHKPKVQYFVGPGGPVPITPGYVPYIVTTRSPRDFFSFAPMNPNAP